MIPANKQNHARRHVGMVLALVGLISAASLATGPIRESSAQADASSWSYTGSPNTARPGHSATLLPKQPAANPRTSLIGKKAGTNIKAGDHIQVRNPNGSLSEEFIFTGL